MDVGEGDRIKKGAERRVNRVLNALRWWGNLSGWRFGMDKDSVDRMYGAIDECLNEQRARFKTQKAFSFAEEDDEPGSTGGTDEDSATVE